MWDGPEEGKNNNLSGDFQTAELHIQANMKTRALAIQAKDEQLVVTDVIFSRQIQHLLPLQHSNS